MGSKPSERNDVVAQGGEQMMVMGAASAASEPLASPPDDTPLRQRKPDCHRSHNGGGKGENRRLGRSRPPTNRR